MNCDEGVLLQAVAAVLGLMVPTEYLNTLRDATFFCSVREYLVQDMLIDTYRDAAAARIATALAVLSTTIITIWVIWHGFQLISGTQRKPLMSLVLDTGKLVFILALVSLVAANSPFIATTVLDFQRLVTTAVVGEDTNVYRMIDINLGLAQVINQVINNLAGGQQAGATGNSLTTAAGLLGQSGPAMITTVLALLAEIAIIFAIMLAPLFIFFLLFQQTAPLFWSWSKFLLGTFVSLAALALVSGIALRISAVYGASVLLAYYTNASAIGSVVSYDISGSAMRMATLGTLMSAIIISIPPMILQFFNAGVGFATGAMGGMMGGALAGRMAGGGTGVPGMTYGGMPGAGAAQAGAPGSYGSSPPALSDNATASAGSGGRAPVLLPQFARGGGSDAVAAPAGSHGLNASNSVHPQVLELRGRQSGSEFRDGSAGPGAYSEALVIEHRSTEGRDPTLSLEGQRAVDANPRLGQGGSLRVSGSLTPTHAPLPAGGPPGGGGSGASGGAGGGAGAGSSGSGRSAETPIGDTPPPHAPTHASAARPQPRSNTYGTQTRQT